MPQTLGAPLRGGCLHAPLYCSCPCLGLFLARGVHELMDKRTHTHTRAHIHTCTHTQASGLATALQTLQGLSPVVEEVEGLRVGSNTEGGVVV